MATGWSNEETFKFIELYQTCPEIWDPKHKYHKDKNKVSDAWGRIADEMLVPVGELKKKKDTLLAAFRLNHKKVVASRKSGVGENDVRKPIWIFYDALAAFMSDVYGCKSILATEDSADVKDADGIADTQPSPRPQQSINSSQVSIPVQKRRSNNPPELAETSAQMKSALSTLNDALTAKKNRVEKVVEGDDCDLYGRLLAKVLREFNEIDRLELRHEIDGLIIKKKRSLISRRYVASPSQIILSTNRPSTSHSTYSEKMTDDYPSSPYVIHRPSSSRSMYSYSSPSPSPNRIQNQQNISRHVYAVASPPDFQTMERQQSMSPHVYGVASPHDYQTMESQQSMSPHVYGVASPPDCQAMESQQNTAQHVYGVASPPDCQAMASQQNTAQHVYAVASPPCQEDQSSDILLKACLNADI